MKQRILALLTALSSLLMGPAVSAAITDIDQVIARFEPKLDAYLSLMPPPGVAVAIIYKGQIRHIICRGTTEFGRPEVITEDTVFPVASLAKSFAATLAALLDKEQVLSLEDQVIQYLPDLKLHTTYATRSLQIKDIIGQTTGLPSRALGELMDKGLPFEAVITQLPKLPLPFAQGREFSYQNVVYNLMDPILHAAADIPYATLVEERFFKPLRMTNASLGLRSFLNQPNRITPHVWSLTNQTWKPKLAQGPAFDLYASSGMNASIKDMAIWVAANLQGRRDVIAPKTLQRLHQPRTPTPRTVSKFYPFSERLTKSSYGLGWSVYRWAGEDVVTQGGLLWGAEHRIAFIPKHQVGIVILSNGLFHPTGETFWSMGIMATFLDIVMGMPDINWGERVKSIIERARQASSHPVADKTTRKEKKAKRKFRAKSQNAAAPCAS